MMSRKSLGPNRKYVSLNDSRKREIVRYISQAYFDVTAMTLGTLVRFLSSCAQYIGYLFLSSNYITRHKILCITPLFSRIKQSKQS